MITKNIYITTVLLKIINFNLLSENCEFFSEIIFTINFIIEIEYKSFFTKNSKLILCINGQEFAL